MPKFTLTAEWDDDTKVTHTFNQETLDEVVMYMEHFLRGCGYFYDGELTICEQPGLQYNTSCDPFELDCRFEFSDDQKNRYATAFDNAFATMNDTITTGKV